MNNKRSIIISILIIIVVFIASFIIVLLLKNANSSVSEKNHNLLSVDIMGSDECVLKSVLPMNDDLGKTIEKDSVSSEVEVFSEFVIFNDTNDKQFFEIYVKKSDNVSNEISSKYIKFYLTDDKNNPVGEYSKNMLPTYYSLKYISDDPSLKKIFGDYIDSKDTKKFKLRVWISDSYVLSSRNEAFKFSVGVRNK